MNNNLNPFVRSFGQFSLFHSILIVFTLFVLSGCMLQTSNSTLGKPQPKKAAKSYYDLGVAYMQKGRFSLAESKLQRSIASHPTPEAYNALALIYETLNDNALAEETYQELLGAFPEYSRGYMNYHIFLCKYQRLPQIRQLAEQMANRGKAIAAIGQVAAGDCARSQGDMTLAKIHYNRALQFEPYSAGALLPLAEIDLDMGFATEAKTKIDLVNNYIGYSPRSVYLSVLANRELGNRLEERKMINVMRARYANTAEANQLFQ